MLGESINDALDVDDQLELPSGACDLPRPHTLVQPRDSQKKVEPHDISISEFAAESMRLISRLAKSKSQVASLIEYSEYVEFLINRSVDYSTKSVLAFDNDFRNRAAFEKIGLGDSDVRGNVSDCHFHAASRKPYQVAVGQPFRGQYRATAGGQPYAAAATGRQSY